MKILVTGGTGTVGSQVVSQLLERNAEVSVLTRDPHKASQLPAGINIVQGDLQDPATIKTAFNGYDGLFLLNAVSQTEANEGLMALNGAKMAGIGKIVYLSVHHAIIAGHLPHFGSKVGIENAIKQSGIPHVILRPNNYYQNDYWFKDPLLGWGIYPQPIGDIGVSRVDVRDIAEAAAIGFYTNEHDGETFNLVGPEALTGNATSAIWGEILGKEVQYGGNDLDSWEQQMLAYSPAWMVFDFKLMYKYFQDHGLLANGEDIAKLTKLLGHAPRPFREFAVETAQMWNS